MTTCIYRGSDQPRAIRGRHLDDCPGECRGCEPCLEPHCPGCNLIHGRSVCPGCMADLRTDLAEIVRMADALPAEAVRKGVESEAFALAGPVADPEAFEHRTLSAVMGRIDAGWLDCADDLAHPLWVLGTAELRAREVLGLAEPEGRVDVLAAARWLGERLSILAACEDHDWPELRRDLAGCRLHMERVLHDGEQVVEGAPCMTCGSDLRRVLTGEEMPWTYRDGSHPHASEDGWACRRCRLWHTEAQYRLAVEHAHRQHQLDVWREAEWLTAPQMEAAWSIKPGALTGWASKGEVGKHEHKDAEGRVRYSVEDARVRAGQVERMGA